MKTKTDHAPEVEQALAALRALYAALDAQLAAFACDSSTECCQFGVTGREPYLTRLEEELLRRALRQRPAPKRLPIAIEARARRCLFLDANGRCGVYAHRPLGCRTFFCERRTGPARWPRQEVLRAVQQLAELSARSFPHSRESRPLSRLFAPRS